MTCLGIGSTICLPLGPERLLGCHRCIRGADRQIQAPPWTTKIGCFRPRTTTSSASSGAITDSCTQAVPPHTA